MANQYNVKIINAMGTLDSTFKTVAKFETWEEAAKYANENGYKQHDNGSWYRYPYALEISKTFNWKFWK